MVFEDDINSIDNIFNDLNHPNPNINIKAYEEMRRRWPEQSIQRLIENLDNKNIDIRRKSVKGIAYFGIDIVDKIIILYFSTNNETIMICCLKILTLIASKYDLIEFQEELNILIESALATTSPEITLMSISLLRQIGEKSVPSLKLLCRDENILKAKAAITALIEINDSSLQLFLLELSQDNKIDVLIRDNAKEALGI